MKPKQPIMIALLIAMVAALLPAIPAAAASPEFVGLRPVRVADTRNGTGVPAGKIGGGGTLSVPVAGSYGVPADAKAVSLNVTVTEPAAAGYVTVYPCGSARPLASNLNFTAAQTVPNAVVVKPGSGGAVCAYAMVATHLVVDLNGYFPSNSAYTGIVPTRAADTRDGTGVPAGMVPASQTLAVPVAGRYGIPAGVDSVALNVTVTEPATAGYATVWPCGQPRPFASNLNFSPGQTVPNAVVAGVGGDGTVCIFTTSRTHLVVDVGGYFGAGSDYIPVVPERVFDTRDEVDGKLPTGYYIQLNFAEPGELRAVVLNVTVTEPDGPGFVTVYPCSQGLPLASNLNFVWRQTVPNMVIAPVDAEGDVCFYTSTSTHILADINGAIPG